METNAIPEEPEAMEPKPTQIVPVVRAAPPVAVKTPRALMLAQALDEDKEQRALLKRYVDEFMIQGEDYGIIPGTERKDRNGKEQARRGLFKPGAEKLLDLFRCRPEYEVMAKEVNHTTGLYYYEIKCRAVSRETDTILNEGVGSASSYESKYRYRNAGRVCPHCGKDTIIKGKAEYGGGWICFAKKGGCGAKWDDGAAEIEGQEVGKVQNPDLADVANTVLKMAKKRAQVDCAIALARVSDMFTQDIEDMADAAEALQHDAAAHRQAPKPQDKPKPSARVNELWEQAGAQWDGKERERQWRKASVAVFGAKVPPPTEWKLEQVEAVAAKLFPADPAAGQPIPF